MGQEVIQRLKNESKGLNKNSIQTGVYDLDMALNGGLPKGRIIEIYGPESSGKTLLCLTAIAECQKNNGIAAFIDAEHALDGQWATLNGVNMDNLLFSQPANGEEAIETLLTLIKTGMLDIAVVDSVSALVPKDELEGAMDEYHVGKHPRLMSKAMRKLAAAASAHNTLVIFINQLREKIGVMYGNPETTTGGRALKFFASVRLETRKGGVLQEKGKEVGFETKVKVVKSKVSPPLVTLEYPILFKSGINKNYTQINGAINEGIVEKNGAWFVYKDSKIQGFDNMVAHLEENNLLDEIKSQLILNK